MSAPAHTPATGFPYPDPALTATGAMRKLGSLDPWPQDTPGDSLVPAEPLPVRKPGKTLPPYLAGRSRAAAPGVPLDLLRDVRAGLRRLPDERDGSVYAASFAEHFGTAPQQQQPLSAPVAESTPVPAAEPPAPEPPAAEPFPGWLREFLVALTADAAIGISTLIARDGGTPEIYERAGQCARLAGHLAKAADSGAAVRTLLAEGWR